MAFNPFIFGLNSSITDSPFLNTKKLSDRVGGNTGNLAFHHAIDSHLGGNRPVVGWDEPVDTINARGDLCVIPCANQLGPHLVIDSLQPKIEKFNMPVLAIGLGAESSRDMAIPKVPEPTLRWVEAMGNKSLSNYPNISTRGAFSWKVLDHYGLGRFATPLGCPSLFINPTKLLGKQIELNIKHPKRIAVTAGHFWWTHLATLEQSLFQMALCTDGAYVGQSPTEMIALTRGEASSLPSQVLDDCRAFAAPSMDAAEFANWMTIRGAAFFDVPSWMEFYRRFDFVVGTRIHGVILALQVGIPALCIAHDSRTLELCQTMMVPHVTADKVVGGITRDSLIRLLNFDAISFDENRISLCHKYIDFLKNNGISPASSLLSIIE